MTYGPKPPTEMDSFVEYLNEFRRNRMPMRTDCLETVSLVYPLHDH